MDLLHAHVYGHYKYVALFKKIGNIVCVHASLDAYYEDDEYYIQPGVF